MVIASFVFRNVYNLAERLLSALSPSVFRNCMKVRVVALYNLLPSHRSLCKSRLSPTSIILLKKLIVSRLDKEFTDFYEMGKLLI
jgi:hypothetical protein